MCQAYLFEKVLIFSEQIYSPDSLTTQLLQIINPGAANSTRRLRLGEWISFELGGATLSSVNFGKFGHFEG